MTPTQASARGKVQRHASKEPAGAGIPAFDPEKAGKVASSVEILGVELVGAHFTRRDDATLPAVAGSSYSIPAFNINADWNRSEDGSILGCTVTFATDFGDSEAPPYQLVAQFRLIYSLPQSTILGNDEVDNFVYWNVVFNAWPYWREYLSSTVNRANLPKFIVPVMKLPLAGVTAPVK
jgi:hypothetical protein